MTNKISNAQKLILALPFLLVVTACGSYYAGKQEAQSKPPEVLTIRSQSTDTYNADLVDAKQAELNKLTNDYESACYNYQALYEAYDGLYQKYGADSGIARIVRPDSARGNEVSCYR
jgi:predicted component of type VI protein secretion system